jgi:hypothetical protein
MEDYKFLQCHTLIGNKPPRAGWYTRTSSGVLDTATKRSITERLFHKT